MLKTSVENYEKLKVEALNENTYVLAVIIRLWGFRREEISLTLEPIIEDQNQNFVYSIHEQPSWASR